MKLTRPEIWGKISETPPRSTHWDERIAIELSGMGYEQYEVIISQIPDTLIRHESLRYLFRYCLYLIADGHYDFSQKAFISHCNTIEADIRAARDPGGEDVIHDQVVPFLEKVGQFLDKMHSAHKLRSTPNRVQTEADMILRYDI